MKINRQALIEIVKTRLNEWEIDRERRHEQAVREWTTAKLTYDKHTANAWLEFAITIQRRISEGKLITRDDIPKEIKTRGSWTSLKIFDEKRPLLPTPSDNERQLRRLIELLKNSVDEEVSTYSLEKLGFHLGRVLK